MPRINTEDELFKTKAWIDLVVALQGDRAKALGEFTWALIVAQSYYYPDRKRIPRQVWMREGLHDALIKCGLADENEDGIHLLDSENQFQWLFENAENGRKGGKISAQRPRDERGRLLPRDIHEKPPSQLGEVQAPLEWLGEITKPSNRIQTSSSSSSSYKEEEEEKKNPPPPPPKVSDSKPPGPIPELADLVGAKEYLDQVKAKPQLGWIRTFGLELTKQELPKIFARWESNDERNRKGNFPLYVTRSLELAQRDLQSGKISLGSQVKAQLPKGCGSDGMMGCPFCNGDGDFKDPKTKKVTRYCSPCGGRGKIHYTSPALRPGPQSLVSNKPELRVVR